jgi:C4-type Zn-finger protein
MEGLKMAKYKYLSFQRKDYRLWDWRDIEGSCPKCGKVDIEFMSVTVQFGFQKHKITSFARCKHCAHHFVWVEETKKSSKKIHEMIQAFVNGEATNGNE